MALNTKCMLKQIAYAYTVYVVAAGIISLCIGIPAFGWYVILPLITGSSAFTAYNLLIASFAVVVIITVGLPLYPETPKWIEPAGLVIYPTIINGAICVGYLMVDGMINYIENSTLQASAYPDPGVPFILSVIIMLLLVPVTCAYARCKYDKET